jgi:hypothetical protein
MAAVRATKALAEQFDLMLSWQVRQAVDVFAVTYGRRTGLAVSRWKQPSNGESAARRCGEDTAEVTRAHSFEEAMVKRVVE